MDLGWARALGMKLGLAKGPQPSQPFTFAPGGGTLRDIVATYGDSRLRLPDMQSPNVIDRRQEDWSALLAPAQSWDKVKIGAREVGADLGFDVYPKMPAMFADDVNAVLNARAVPAQIAKRTDRAR